MSNLKTFQHTILIFALLFVLTVLMTGMVLDKVQAAAPLSAIKISF